MLVALACCAVLQTPPTDSWHAARTNGEQARAGVAFCVRYANGWLAHADPQTGLLPRTLKGDAYWNAKDCAADNFPFLAMTAHLTGQPHLLAAARHILAQEKRLTLTPRGLPDDFVFANQALRAREPQLDELIFGAAEYCKDGLLPLVEWTGDDIYRARLLELLHAITAHAAVPSQAGPLPSSNLEVNGDLLQAYSRASWMADEPRFAQMAMRLGDHYLLHRTLLDEPTLALRDHGCEVIGGLAEAYVLAASRDRERHARWRAPMHALLDCIATHGVRSDGLLHHAIDPRSGAAKGESASDGWGYVLDAFLTVAEVDGEVRYRDLVTDCLARVKDVRIADTPGLGGADGCADTLEGALNLLARIPDAGALAWVDREIARLFTLQRKDGVIEAWYGDGNSARTAWMWVLGKTCGAIAQPWREDLTLGAERTAGGGVRLVLRAEFAWSGTLCFDRPRHAEIMRLPLDYARINQWPQSFTVAARDPFVLTRQDAPPQRVRGEQLRAWPLQLSAGQEVALTVEPAPATTDQRLMRYATGDAAAARAWQQELRGKLTKVLAVDDLVTASVPIDLVKVRDESRDGVLLRELEFQSTASRRLRATWAEPADASGRLPAVLCIHGHGGTRGSVHDQKSIYRGVATDLAHRGYVTIACDVGQHNVQEPGRTLMGERFWDVRRCVDVLCASDRVDPARIGCVGLSLGGEMAMWLGALDERVKAVCSSGFLTTMDQMEQGHCMCWHVDGLRQLVDWADLYALIAPRPLQCQNGLLESPKDFYVPLARLAMREITPIYRDLGAPHAVSLHVHGEGHVLDVAALRAFLLHALAD